MNLNASAVFSVVVLLISSKTDALQATVSVICVASAISIGVASEETIIASLHFEFGEDDDAVNSSQRVLYQHAQVWRTFINDDDDDTEIFRKLDNNDDISLWRIDKSKVDYLVHENKQLRMYKVLRKTRLSHTVLIDNVESQIHETRVRMKPWTPASLRAGHRLDFKDYPSLQIIDEYYTALKENYASICKISSLGNTVENRPIHMIRVSNGDPKNQAVVITGGQHAREWAGIAAALYVADNIVTKFDQLPHYMKDKDWYIIPVANPDGFSHSQTKDRLWRKNRRRVSDGCYGVDLNRNYPTAWSIPGVSETSPCACSYSGPYSFSEPESLAILGLIKTLDSTRLGAYVDIHSYGQLIMYPWGYNSTPSHQIGRLRSTANAMKQIIKTATGKTYQAGTPGELIYSVSGSTFDWMHSKGFPLSFAFEVRDTGSHGFLLPRPEIEPTGKEMLGAVLELAKALEPTYKLRSQKRKWL